MRIMGFDVLHPDLRRHMKILGVSESPNGDAIMRKLSASPPSLDKAQLVFSTLASKHGIFTQSDWCILQDLKFIPYADNGNKAAKYEAPGSVYIRCSSASLYAHIFVFVDFGINANSFLRSCGAKEEPTTLEIARYLINDPNDFLAKLGSEKYLNLLMQIASHFDTLHANQKLFQDMKSSPFLIATQSSSNSEGSDGNKYQLAKASDIYLIDDTVLGQLFNPLGAPMEESLENLYFSLGALWLSASVRQEFKYHGQPMMTEESISLKKLVSSRYVVLTVAQLFCFMTDFKSETIVTY
jgi:Protein of unknown function (DUF3684)